MKSKLQIGIPRAISYYNNYPFYYGFFTKLGYEIILSDKTTSKTINNGTKYVVSDTCLPIKVYVGHIINLLEKDCKTIFVPSLQSTGYKINNCSKIRGLPELIRNVIDIPFKMIEPTLDKTEGITFKDFCYDIASQLNITDTKVIKTAIAKGWEVYDNFTLMAKSGIPQNQAMKNAIEGKYIEKNEVNTNEMSIVLMAHGYNLYDEQISMKLLDKLESLGIKVYTGLNISRKEAIDSLHMLGEIQYWANELDLTGCAAYHILKKDINGIIALSAFGCGPDSLMVDEIQFHAEKANIPMLHLTIDEHTGEAGFITRLEAFVDMLERKRRRFKMKIKQSSSNSVTSIKTNINEEDKILTRV